MNAMLRNALRQYGTVGVNSVVEDATPHRLIQLLLDGALARLAMAEGQMERGELAAKGESLGGAISIIGGLQGSLNLEAGGEVAQNLDRLYDYMVRRLLEASLRNDVGVIEEVKGLLLEVKAGWDAIGTFQKSPGTNAGVSAPTPQGHR